VYIRALQGALTGSGAPLGWALIQLFRGVDIPTDFAANQLLYFYMLFGTATVFSCFGFYVGYQESLSNERSRLDPLTKLFNLRHFREQLEIQLAQTRRDSTPVSLIFFDLDHFKKVNDTFGHAAGDTVLINVSQAVSHILRLNELVARVGGEEFAVIVPHSTAEAASKLAERIRSSVAELAFDVGAKKPIHVTLSLGVTEYMEGDTAISLTERADTAMYEAKRSGRNKVVLG